MKYSENQSAMCQMIYGISNVTIPIGMTKKDYWNDALADLTNSGSGSYRSNRVQGRVAVIVHIFCCIVHSTHAPHI